MFIEFDSLPDTARIWVFPITNDINDFNHQSLEHAFKEFVQEWTSHNNSLRASAKMIGKHLMVVAVDEVPYGASGCSIDKLMRFVQNIESNFEIQLLLKTKILVKQNDELKPVELSQIRSRLNTGELKPDDEYIDILVGDKQALQTGLFKKLNEGWLSKRILN